MNTNKSVWQSMSSDEKQSLADKCGTNKAYLSQVANGFKTASPELANKIHFETGGEWSRLEINPSVFNDPIAQQKVANG